jgi:RNA polymerase sigma-70 factor (ECF subfamily)
MMRSTEAFGPLRLTSIEKRKSGPRSSAAGRPFCDRALVLRAQSGECRAFDMLMGKYRPRIMRLAMRYTRNTEDAEDVVQDTFLKAFRALRQFRGDSAFYSWLHRIAINATKTAWMARRRDLSVMAPTLDSSELVEGLAMPRDFDTPEELALTEEIFHVVNTAIEKLCEEQRAAIVLRELEGLSYAEVASRMSCPIGTVRSRVFRAREAIDIHLRRVFDHGLSRANRVAPLHRCSEKELEASA